MPFNDHIKLQICQVDKILQNPDLYNIQKITILNLIPLAK